MNQLFVTIFFKLLLLFVTLRLVKSLTRLSLLKNPTLFYLTFVSWFLWFSLLFAMESSDKLLGSFTILYGTVSWGIVTALVIIANFFSIHFKRQNIIAIIEAQKNNSSGNKNDFTNCRVVIRRRSIHLGSLTLFTVIFDGLEVGFVANGDMLQINTDCGIHTLQLKYKHFSSKSLSLDLKQGDTLEISCQMGRYFLKYLIDNTAIIDLALSQEQLPIWKSKIVAYLSLE